MHYTPLTPHIYLSSWPRSGNTFVRLLLWHQYGIETSSQYPHENTLLGDAEAIIGHSRTPRLFQKTHLSPAHLDSHAKIIYIYRDGLEACQSCADYMGAPWHTLVTGNTFFGRWSDHVREAVTDPRYGTTDMLVLKFDKDHPTKLTAALKQWLGHLGTQPILEPTPLPTLATLCELNPYLFGSDSPRELPSAAHRELFFAHNPNPFREVTAL